MCVSHRGLAQKLHMREKRWSPDQHTSMTGPDLSFALSRSLPLSFALPLSLSLSLSLVFLSSSLYPSLCHSVVSSFLLSFPPLSILLSNRTSFCVSNSYATSTKQPLWIA